MNSFASPSIASAGDWRKRRRFMDVTRPKVEALLPRGREERIYEDSLFAEVSSSSSSCSSSLLILLILLPLQIGLDAARVEELRAHIEQEFSLSLDAGFVRAAESLASAFDFVNRLETFLPELSPVVTPPALTVAALGVPLWLSEANKFALKDGAYNAELCYKVTQSYGRDVIAFTEATFNSSELCDDLIAFALAECVRRDLRVDVSGVKDMHDYVEKHPGWYPYIVGAK